MDYFLYIKLTINSGDVINNITFLYEVETKRYLSGTYRQFRVRCHCGNEFNAILSRVKAGICTSCGCIRIKKQHDAVVTHGLSKHRLYQTWKAMMRRCYNTTHKDYMYYGGTGITVCDRWHTCKNFIDDLDNSYIPGYTLDRINPYGNYEFSNCRWADIITQANNKRKDLHE